MKAAVLLLVLLSSGCAGMQLAVLRERYPVQNGRTWIKPAPPTPEEHQRLKDGAVVFACLAAFAVMGWQLYSDSQTMAVDRRLRRASGIE